MQSNEESVFWGKDVDSGVSYGGFPQAAVCVSGSKTASGTLYEWYKSTATGFALKEWGECAI